MISLPGVVAPAGAGKIVLRIRSVHIAGGSVYSDAELQALTDPLSGKEVALAQIYELAQTLTAKYGADGYVLSRAIVPPQQLDQAGADVTIQIVEGYVDQVQWPPSIARYRDFFSAYTARITAERPTNIKTVMRYLLLAGDLPGLDVSSSFQASETNPNASTLVVEVTEKRLDVSARIDNRGTEARGPWQFSTSATFNNVLGWNEALTIGYSGAVELNELQYLSAGYRQVMNAEGLYVFGGIEYSWGAPGSASLQALDFKSSSLALDAGFAFPVLRSRDQNVTLSGLIFLSDSQGQIFGAPSSEDRLRGFGAKADFDAADGLNGITQGSVRFSQGLVGFGSTLDGNPLASRQNGRVDFTTLQVSLSRPQPLGNGFSILTAADAQYAFTPLLSSEECGYGGKSFGRAFDPSEITGDTCWSVTGGSRPSMRCSFRCSRGWSSVTRLSA